MEGFKLGSLSGPAVVSGFPGSYECTICSGLAP